jgi:DNA-binding phage protein
MVLTRHFRETIQTRAQEDSEYRQALLAEAMNCFLSGEIEVGKSLLRDYINATVGFEALAKAVGKPSKSLHRMLAPTGNPSTKSFFEIVRFLQQNEGVSLEVSTHH